MIRAELVVTGLREVATLADGPIPRVGAEMARLGFLSRACLGVDRGRFVYVGTEKGARSALRLRSGGRRVDAGDRVALPGFVDAHSHLLFAGDRSTELAQKVAGKSYLEIARSGGGLYSTVRSTRRASSATLLRESGERLRRLGASGVTSVEVKSGYALDHAGEIRLLRLLPALARSSGLRIVPTYLGAHAVPPEHLDRPDRYVEEIVQRTLPEVAGKHRAKFCDVFCEPGFFNVEQARRILRAAVALGLGLKIHADEFVASGGARLAAELRTRSAEHLLVAPAEDRERLADAGVCAVLLPTTPFASMAALRSPGRELVDAGVPVALGTDLSPNSWVTSMPLVLAHAVYSARLSPEEAVAAATINAAHAIGLGDSAGRIAVGLPADFLLYDLPTVTQIPYRIGAVPHAIYRQGIARSPAELGP